MRELSEIYSLSDEKLDRVSPSLPIIIGLPVKVTSIISVPLGVANGSNETIIEDRYPARTMFPRYEFEGLSVL